MPEVAQFARQKGMSPSAPERTLPRTGKRLGRLSHEQIADIVRRKDAGEPARSIAASIGRSIKVVEYWARQRVPGRSRGVKADSPGELGREKRAEREAQERRSAERQLRAHRARQAALAAVREYVPGYDGVARGCTGLRWHSAHGGHHVS